MNSDLISLLIRDGKVFRRIDNHPIDGRFYFTFEKIDGVFVRCEWMMRNYFLLHYPRQESNHMVKIWEFVREEPTLMAYMDNFREYL